MKEAYAGNDPDLKEAYVHLTRRELKKRIEWFETLIEDALRHGGNAKKVRKPRKKKAVPASKKLKTFKYQKSDTSHKIASINPENVLGAQELWIYNSKTRKLGKYVAEEFKELGVKGTTITGFSEMKSVQKTLRKPVDQLKEFKAAGKVALRKFLEDINAVDTKMNGRLNEDTLLLKVA